MIYQTNKEDSKNITDLTRSFLVALKRAWPKWMDALIIVKPETVIDWQRRRFKKYWTKKSAKRKKLGRLSIILEIRQLIEKMVTENFIGYIKDIILFNTNDIPSAFAPSLGEQVFIFDKF
jgi:hypothetical protein